MFPKLVISLVKENCPGSHLAIVLVSIALVAGLKGSMGTVRPPIEPVDQDFLDGLIIRWRLAEQYIEDLEMKSLPAETALKILMQHDFPMLLKEIVRLRPELS